MANMAAPGARLLHNNALFRAFLQRSFFKHNSSQLSTSSKASSWKYRSLFTKLLVGSAGVASVYVGVTLKTTALFPDHHLQQQRQPRWLPTVNAAAKIDEAKPSKEELNPQKAALLKSTVISNVDSASLPWHFSHEPTKKVRHVEGETTLTLYQYVTCPFCCKVRAYLDYYGINYNIVEVDSIKRTQKKWTKYPKVPILVCDGIGDHGFTQLNDSSMIISLLHSERERGGQGELAKLLTYYPTIESKEGKKLVYDYPNKYFIMYEERAAGKNMAELREEREWREWVDNNLVHILSPNIYRTLSEAIRSFQWFSEAGDWESCMTTSSRLTCVYAGALAMWAVSGRLKRKYELDDDVRQNLYKSVNDWLEGVGPSRKFMGGDKPNLADLAVYGVMWSIEGTQAFQDLTENTKFLSWYQPMKEAVLQHQSSAVSLQSAA